MTGIVWAVVVLAVALGGLAFWREQLREIRKHRLAMAQVETLKECFEALQFRSWEKVPDLHAPLARILNAIADREETRWLE